MSSQLDLLETLLKEHVPEEKLLSLANQLDKTSVTTTMTKEQCCKCIIGRLTIKPTPCPQQQQAMEKEVVVSIPKVKAEKEKEEEYAYESRKYPIVRVMPPEVHIRLSRISGMKLIKRDGQDFHIQGQTDKYLVNIGTVPTCNCPDDTPICKHILFVYLNVLKIPKTSYLIYQEALLKREWNGILNGKIPSNEGGEMDDESGEFVSYDPLDNYQDELMRGKRRYSGRSGFSSSKKRR